jgi:perosamine synthetase
MERIPVAGPSITQKEIDYVTEAVKRAWYAEANRYHELFERAFAEYIGVRFALALPSCTSALHLSLLALGVGPGDEVIVPDITWIASAAPIHYVGATPVFADVDPDTWCLSVEAFRRAVTPRTRAAIPVDLYGGMPDLVGLREAARAGGIAIIEDAAEAIGSELGGRRAGSFGDTGTFSFHGSKTLTTGEGGMLVTDRAELVDRALFLRDHGRRAGEKRMFFSSEVAYKYKMSGLQAALGLAQLERIEELVERKRRIFGWYRERLGEVRALRLNHEPAGVRNSYWMITVVLAPELGLTKERVIEALAEKGIDSRPFFYPLSSLPAYEGTPAARRAREENRVAYALSPYGVNLPSGLELTESQVSYVCECVEQLVRRAPGSTQTIASSRSA